MNKAAFVPVIRAFGAALLLSASLNAAEEWVPLFDGTTLEGWRPNENQGSVKVQDGMIVCDGPRSHLFYDGPAQNGRFQNFELKLDVRTQPGANSGVFFHTTFQESGWPARGYEVQINNSAGGEGGYLERKKTGSLYGIRNLYFSPARDNEWFTLHIVVQANHVQVRVDGKLVVDYLEPESPVRDPERPLRVLSEGTFALQCHDPESVVHFRNIYVKPLADDLPRQPVTAGVGDQPQLISLYSQNFPVTDLHAHLKGGLTIEEVVEKFRRTGINYGIAVNCGLGFPVTNDAGIHAFVERMKGQPVFVGMQAEGREWTRLFSQQALQQFDYVFTDAMTFTDDAGRRTRLWMPNEVYVEDSQAFMEMLVSRIEGILSTEPIDIYVNPTYLPAVIADEYAALWTEERMQRVIDAAVKHDVAIEINARFRIPSAAFIKQAKKAGAKFTFGTNNGGRDDLGTLEYCLQIQRECGLTWEDMFVPDKLRGTAPLNP